MPTYAADTSVPVERSKNEKERTLERYGADAFMYGWDRTSNAAVMAFEVEGRRIRFEGSSDTNAPEHSTWEDETCPPGLHDFSVGVQCAICGEYNDYP